MRFLFIFLFFGNFIISYAQSDQDSVAVDTKYLEDQFYIGVTYNFLLNKPEGVTQRNLSYGLQGGFIKDIPINPRRNVAFGIGLGYAVNSYYNNIFVNESGNSFLYTVLDNTSFKRNKIETHLIEMPLEFRWRNSTTTSYKFYRIYTGLKLGYVVGSRSKFVSDDKEVISFYNTDTRNFRYGITLNFGYNTFNIHAYYALNNLFNDGVETIDGTTIDVTPLRIGLIFYIL